MAANRPDLRRTETLEERYLEHLRWEEHLGALLVSAADKLHNARAILADYRTQGERLWERFNAPGRDLGEKRKNILWYYGELARVFRDRLPGPLAGELGRVVGELKSLAAPASAEPSAGS